MCFHKIQVKKSNKLGYNDRRMMIQSIAAIFPEWVNKDEWIVEKKNFLNHVILQDEKLSKDNF